MDWGIVDLISLERPNDLRGLLHERLTKNPSIWVLLEEVVADEPFLAVGPGEQFGTGHEEHAPALEPGT